MCLVTDKLEKNIAKEDMVVYKSLYHSKRGDDIIIKSSLMEFEYEIGILYKTQITTTLDESCFDTIAIRYLRKLKEKGSKIQSFEEGFHSARTYERLNTDEHRSIYAKIHKSIIPAGSEYYEDGTDLIVSNQIIITDEICA